MPLSLRRKIKTFKPSYYHMIKKIVKDTVKTLINRPKLIRLALLTSYAYTLYQIYWIVYFINWIVQIQYNSGVDISAALAYFVNAIQKFNIFRFILTIAILFVIWLAIFSPIWRQALLYSIDDEKLSSWKAFIKWWKRWGPMAEFGWVNMWWLSMWSVFIFLVRFRMLGYLNNFVVKMVFFIRISCVVAKTILRPYVNYFIVLRNCSAWDAVIKSMSLSLSNFMLTIRWLLRQAVIRIRFFLNSALLIWIPVFLMSLAVHFDIINNSAVEIIARILVFLAILIFVYLEAIFKAFDFTYRYNLFLEAEKRDNK